MTEYIDKNNLIADIIKEVKSDDEWKTAYDILNIVRCYPTSDVRENVKAKWIYIDSDSERYDDIRCSNCGRIYTVDAYHWCDIGFIADDLKYCPNCGARMEVRDETD